MHTSRAVWPITDTGTGMLADDLIHEAILDLHNVANRHRVRITGAPYFQLRSGRNVQGSQGATYVITCDVPAEPIHRAEYGHTQLLEISA